MATRKTGTAAKGKQVPRDWLAEFALKAAIDDKALLSVREWIAEQFIGDEYAQLGHAGHGDTQIPLRKVFVDLPIGTHALSSSERAGETTPFLKEMLTFEASSLKELSVARFFDRDETRGDEMPEIAQPRARDRRKQTKASLMGCRAVGTILVGGPGQGKSTLCQLLCQLHRAALLQGDPRPKSTIVEEVLAPFKKVESESSIVLPLEPLLPVRIVLPDAATWLVKSVAVRETSDVPILLDFISFQKSAQKAKLTAPTLAALMAHTPFLLVLDGFDEIGAESDRKRIIEAIRELITAFAKRAAKATIVATTRPQGYMGELEGIGAPLVTRYLARLSTKEALDYAFKLIKAKIKGVDEQDKKMEQLRAAAEEPAIARLLETPLQATILAGLVEKGNVPSERWRLFESYLRTVYDREVGRSLAVSKLLEKRRPQIEAIHAHAALLLQVEAEATGGASSKMPRDRFASIVDRVLQDEGVDDERADLVESIVKIAENRLVFLVEPEPGFFGFEIRSLQEFMAARALSVDVKESLVEHRIWQIAKAPLFRNVLLFIASKIYGGGSSLREYMVKTACAKLDEDGSDILAQTTKAGALLALEILEEGAVLSSARFARELMFRASGLLDVPVSDVHARLVRAVNKDTEKVFIEALEKRITGDSFTDAVTSWACLNEAANVGHPWADRLADAHWPQVQDPNEILRACLFSPITPSEWFVAKIDEMPELFDPRVLSIRLYLGRRHEVKPLPTRLRGSVAVGINAIVRLQRRASWNRGLRFVKIARPVEPRTDPKDLEFLRDLSPQWRAWVSVIEFEENPSAAQLAITLREIAENMSRSEWRMLGNRVSWPLQACLQAAGNADELEEMAASSEALVLGDRDEWVAAEELWSPVTSARDAVLAARNAKPFTSESIGVGPPIYCFSVHGRSGETRPPAHVSMADWVPVYDELSKHVSQVPRSSTLLAAIEAHLAAPTNPGWIHVMVTSVENVESIQAALRLQLATSLASHAYPALGTRLQVSLLRLWLGDLRPSEADPLLRECAQHVEEDFIELVDIASIVANAAYAHSQREQLLIQWYSLIRARMVEADEGWSVIKFLLDTRRSGLDNVTTWKGLELPQPYPQGRSSEQVRSPIPSQPIVLEKLHLQHVRGIHDLVLEFKPPPPGRGQWIVLLGRNGMGKTTLLKALCLALRNLDNSKIWPDGVWNPPWRELGQDAAARIAVRFAGYDEQVTTIHNGTQSHRQTPPHAEASLFPIFAYGCRRGSALGGEAKAVDLEEESGPEIATLFDEGAGLVHAETWLKDWALYALQDPLNAAPIYDAVLAAMMKLLDVPNIVVEERQVHIVEKNGRKIPFAALSDGYLTTAGLFLDLIARWIELCKRASLNIGNEFLKQMRGLVLIDEIDLHLHPSWQVESIRRTRELLPEMSFVVTTHNPLTLVGARAEEIFKLKERDRSIVAEQGEARPILLTSSEIFTEYFDVADVLPDELSRKLQRYEFLSRYALRSPDEDTDMLKLKADLAKEGIVPNWAEVERVTVSDTNMASTGRKASRRRKMT